MYSRESFDRIRASSKRQRREDGRWLALASIGLGLGQLVFIRWADAVLAHQQAVGLEGILFLAYAGVVGWLFWRLQRNTRSGAPRCAACGSILQGISERIAVATGRCDTCGAQVLE
jgi:hypothetical protein